MSNKQPFTSADEAQLIALWNDNLTVKEIALAMERPYNNIRNKVAALQKKGKIDVRSTKIELPANFVEVTAGAHGLPVELVSFMATLFGGTTDNIISGLELACTAYTNQQGQCYYLKDRIKLSPDNSLTGITLSTGENNEMVLISKAVAMTRNKMSHNTFVALCKDIAHNF